MVKKLLYEPGKLRIRDFVITDEFEVVEESIPIKEAIKKIIDMTRGVLLIKDAKGEIEGVVTERKILQTIVKNDKPLELKVADIMDKHILSILDTEHLKAAVEQIKNEKPAAVIVKNKKGEFKGYFSPVDFQEAEKIIKEGPAHGKDIPSEEE